MRGDRKALATMHRFGLNFYSGLLAPRFFNKPLDLAFREDPNSSLISLTLVCTDAVTTCRNRASHQ